MSPSFEELVELYNTKFKPAYADLVGYIGDRPYDILVELENTLSHIFVSLDSDVPEEVREDNIRKAYNHLIRATLDCYKLLWVRLDEEIEKIFWSDVDMLALTISEEEFLRLRAQFKEKAIEARRRELNGVGKDPLQSIRDYREVVEIGMKIINSIDHNKKRRAWRFRLRSKRWEILLALLLGFVSGILANIVYNKFFCCVFKLNNSSFDFSYTPFDFPKWKKSFRFSIFIDYF